jgi:hypothetical protein
VSSGTANTLGTASSGGSHMQDDQVGLGSHITDRRCKQANALAHTHAHTHHLRLAQAAEEDGQQAGPNPAAALGVDENDERRVCHSWPGKLLSACNAAQRLCVRGQKIEKRKQGAQRTGSQQSVSNAPTGGEGGQHCLPTRYSAGILHVYNAWEQADRGSKCRHNGKCRGVAG